MRKVRLGDVTAYICSAPGDHITKQVREGQFYEHDLLTALRPYLRPDALAIDVGAHVGNHSAFFAAFGPLLAVEPDRSIIPYWLETMQASGRVGMLCAAPVGAVDQQRYALRRFKVNTGATQARPAEDGGLVGTTLDALVGARPVSVVKVDVEGHEAGVLAGAVGILDRGVVLAVEAHNSNRKAAVDAILEPLGYSVTGRYCKSPTYVYERAL